MTDEEIAARRAIALADYEAAKGALTDGAALAEAGPTLIRFSTGRLFSTRLAAVEAFPGQFGDGDRPAYAHPIEFAAEIPGDPIEITEAWLIGEAGAACYTLPQPLFVGGGVEGGLDPVVIEAGTLTW